MTAILDKIVDFYLRSGDFNGISIRRLMEDLNIGSEETKQYLQWLLKDGSISVNFGDRHPNPHVKCFQPEPTDEQLAKLDAVQFDEKPADDGVLFDIPPEDYSGGVRRLIFDSIHDKDYV